jgi:hypothetical protein
VIQKNIYIFKQKKFFLVINNSYGITGHILSLVDLSGGKGRILQLEHAEKIVVRDKNMVEFLSNGDLVLVDRSNYKKIYLYSFKNKPTNTTLWKCSRVYDIEIRQSLDKHEIDYFIYKTKLFFFNDGLVTQWDLLTMTFEMQYNLINECVYNIAINKNETLLVLHTGKYNRSDKKIDVYLMKTGIHISRYG